MPGMDDDLVLRLARACARVSAAVAVAVARVARANAKHAWNAHLRLFVCAHVSFSLYTLHVAILNK